MDQALGWLGEFVRSLAKLIPRLVIVLTTQRLVKFVRGHKVVELGPGLHMYWPVTTEVRVVDTEIQVARTDYQFCVTADFVTCGVLMIISYRISDATKAETRLSSPVEDILDDLCQACTRKVICTQSYETIVTSPAEIDSSLAQQLQKEVRPLGITILSVRLGTFCPWLVHGN